MCFSRRFQFGTVFSMNETKVVAREELPSLAAEVLALAKSAASNNATVIALHGDLGAGSHLPI